MRTLRLKKGFTIVELLIVIVVIAVLAAIIIAGFGLVTKNAADASLKTDLNKVSDTLESENFDSGYPSSLSGLNNGAGPTVSAGTVLQYTGTATSYCITAFSQKANGPFFKASGGGSVQSGMCPGHVNPFAPAPVLAWTTITPGGSNNRSSVASSSDGTKVALSDSQYSPGYIYTSTNSGSSWTSHDLGAGAGGGAFTSLRSSSTGTILATLDTYNRSVYISTDSGTTWVKQTGIPTPTNGGTLAMSTDGQKIAFASVSGSSGSYSGTIYTTTNAGASWTSQAGSPNTGWASIDMSDDGTRMVAASRNGYIYTSTNSGVTWAQQSATAGFNIQTLDASSTTSTIAATSANGTGALAGFVYVSTDYGTTWTKQTSIGSGYWAGIGVSGSGSTILVGADNFSGTVQLSTNSGSTWTQQTSFGSYPNARAISISSDGHTLYIGGGSSNSYRASL